MISVLNTDCAFCVFDFPRVVLIFAFIFPLHRLDKKKRTNVFVTPLQKYYFATETTEFFEFFSRVFSVNSPGTARHYSPRSGASGRASVWQNWFLQWTHSYGKKQYSTTADSNGSPEVN